MKSNIILDSFSYFSVDKRGQELVRAGQSVWSGESGPNITCSHVDVPGLDPPELVLRPAPVGLGVDLLLVVAGLEGRKYEISVVHHLQIEHSSQY